MVYKSFQKTTSMQGEKYVAKARRFSRGRSTVDATVQPINPSNLASTAGGRPTTTQGSGGVRGVGAASPIQSNAGDCTHVVGHVALTSHAINVTAVSLEGAAFIGIPNGSTLRCRTRGASIAADAKAGVASRGWETDTHRRTRARGGTAATAAAIVIVVTTVVAVAIGIVVASASPSTCARGSVGSSTSPRTSGGIVVVAVTIAVVVATIVVVAADGSEAHSTGTPQLTGTVDQGFHVSFFEFKKSHGFYRQQRESKQCARCEWSQD